MDTPKRGRPRKNPPKIKKKTAKLAEALGRADRIKVSVSPTQKAKLSRLATHNQITESEQVRRLIDQAKDVKPDPLVTEPSTTGSAQKI
jgi:hypothetical protein